MRIAALLLIVSSVFFYQSGRRDLTDFRYMLLVSHGLWSDGEANLDAFAPPPHGAPDAIPVAERLPYQFVLHGDEIHHAFPIGTALLLTPVVGLADTVGLSILDESGAYDAKREARFQHYIASIAMSALLVIFLLQARLLLDTRTSLAIAVAAGLATPIWSVGAGTLWSHTLAILLLGAALHGLLRADLRNDPAPPLSAGTLLAWMFVVRPTSAVSIAALSIWVVWRWRQAAWPLLVSGLLWLGAFVGLSLALYGESLPPYYQPERLSPWPSFDALLGNLVSPGRGVLVYIPALLYLAALLHHTWPRLQARGLVVCGSIAGILHWWVISSYPHWWGGHSWGARLMMDLVPWWVLFAILGWAAARDPEAPPRRPAWLHPGVAASLLGLSVLFNAVGIFSDESARWNLHVDIDRHPERVWDWRDPPFLGWLGEDSDE